MTAPSKTKPEERVREWIILDKRAEGGVDVIKANPGSEIPDGWERVIEYEAYSALKAKCERLEQQAELLAGALSPMLNEWVFTSTKEKAHEALAAFTAFKRDGVWGE